MYGTGNEGSGFAVKGVLLSQRPVAAGATGRATAGPAGGGTTAGFGGSMLASGVGGAEPPKKSFLAGRVKESVHPSGYNSEGARRRLLHKRARVKKVTVVDKHKAWLKQLAKQRDDLIKEKQRLEEEAEQKKQRFKAKQAAIRKAVVEQEPGAAPAGPQLLPTRAASREASKPAQKQRPAWSMSAEANEVRQEDEAEDLLAFAENLDFGDYIEDLDVRAALDAVRHRIDEIESKRSRGRRRIEAEEAEDWEYEWVDAGEEAEAEEDGEEGWEWADEEAAILRKPDEGAEGKGEEEAEGAVPRRRLRRRRRVPTGLAAGLGAGAKARASAPQADDAQSVARSVMSTTASMKAVHSSKSAAAVVEREKQRRQAEEAMPAVAEEEEAVATPALLQQRAQAAQQGDGVDASNLPYLHMNPSI